MMIIIIIKHCIKAMCMSVHMCTHVIYIYSAWNISIYFVCGVFTTHIANIQYDEMVVRNLEEQDALQQLRQSANAHAQASGQVHSSVGEHEEQLQNMDLSGSAEVLNLANPFMERITPMQQWKQVAKGKNSSVCQKWHICVIVVYILV